MHVQDFKALPLTLEYKRFTTATCYLSAEISTMYFTIINDDIKCDSVHVTAIITCIKTIHSNWYLYLL